MSGTRQLISVAAALSTFACASAPKLPPGQFDDLRPGSTAYILLYSLKLPSDIRLASDEPYCELTIRNTDTHDEVWVPLQPKREALVLPLSPGAKEFRELNCGQGHRWTFAGNPRRLFRVPTGRVSVGNPLALSVDTASNSFVLGTLDRDATLAGVKKIRAALPENVRESLVSAINAKPITQASLNDNELGQNHVRPLDAHRIKPGESEIPDVKPCYAQEAEENRLWVGTIHYKAIYRAHQLTELKLTQDHSTYSAPFLACVESTLHQFRPKDAGALEYQFAF